MSFDDEVDEVKREMQTAKLDPEARRATAKKLCERLKEQIASRRLDFALAEENGDPIVQVKYKPDSETLASVFVDEDEFLEDAYDMLKVGIAEYELDREQRA